MAKFSVTVRITDYYSVEVEAESMEEAVSEAEMTDVPGPKATYESAGEMEVTSVTNLETKKTRYYSDGIIEEEEDGA